jgi:transposase InsO family protein
VGKGIEQLPATIRGAPTTSAKGEQAPYTGFQCDRGKAEKEDPSIGIVGGAAKPGDRFFQGCLAKYREATEEERRDFRVGVYEQIRRIGALQGDLTIERMCWLAGVSRASYYREWRAQDPSNEELELRDAIQRIAVERRNYGYRRVTQELRHRGWTVNHKRIARLMRLDNLLAVRRKAFKPVTTESDHSLRIYLNVAARMEVSGPDQLWVADITYIRLQTEFVYLAVVLDYWSRKVVGWHLGRSLHSDLALSALRHAIDSRQPTAGLVHHSDRGIQYACNDYVGLLRENGMIPSMSRPANPYDNAVCESFMKTLKAEEITCNEYSSLEDLQSHLETFISGYYNQVRLHSALQYRSPGEFEQAEGENSEELGNSQAAVLSFPRHEEIYPDESMAH